MSLLIMFTLGVTGGIGSGKTTVCRMLESLGARVFYADDEARRLMVEDASLRAELTAAFGSESYLEDSSLNRAYLAGQVFGTPENVRLLNQIVHPRVLHAFAAAREQAEADGVALLVKEAALLFESGGDRQLDAVAVIDTPEQDRIDRVVARDRSDPESVLSRIQHQLPADVLREKADFIIENRGDLESLREQVTQLFHHVTQLRR